jgi:hypothetical protein
MRSLLRVSPKKPSLSSKQEQSNGAVYCPSTVKRLTEYPRAPPTKTSDKK